jgi:cell division protein FtsL
VRGRSIIFLALFGFVVVATGVIWRRSTGLAQARELRELRQRRDALDAQQAALEGAIRDASSRARLARTAEERLGMRVPPESLVIRLPRPTREIPPQ